MDNVFGIEKILSANDVGANGSHQSGMLIPKGGNLLSFFPTLDLSSVNPRVAIYFDDKACQKWKFNFIYYNNKFRGGTRNEYRLTGMTAFFRSNNLKVGDSIIFKHINGEYIIQYTRQNEVMPNTEDGVVRLVLNNEWRIIDF